MFSSFVCYGRHDFDEFFLDLCIHKVNKKCIWERRGSFEHVTSGTEIRKAAVLAWAI